MPLFDQQQQQRAPRIPRPSRSGAEPVPLAPPVGLEADLRELFGDDDADDAAGGALDAAVDAASHGDDDDDMSGAEADAECVQPVPAELALSLEEEMDRLAADVGLLDILRDAEAEAEVVMEDQVADGAAVAASLGDAAPSGPAAAGQPCEPGAEAPPLLAPAPSRKRPAPSASVADPASSRLPADSVAECPAGCYLARYYDRFWQGKLPKGMKHNGAHSCTRTFGQGITDDAARAQVLAFLRAGMDANSHSA